MFHLAIFTILPMPSLLFVLRYPCYPNDTEAFFKELSKGIKSLSGGDQEPQRNDKLWSQQANKQLKNVVTFEVNFETTLDAVIPVTQKNASTIKDELIKKFKDECPGDHEHLDFFAVSHLV
ncbi:unnamed protein product [Cylicocyclus nassatus]|uniref:Uncharacterized protein n=1 Tax=Cylicocyclus nassatus TaxID=53992 RepID=A0AA36GIW6_CYLNA|nr:unnamed protein product [Cylicocyclus nassatus]